jgi:hypothetical protein
MLDEASTICLLSIAPLSLPVFAMLMLLFLETATTGAVGVIHPLTLAGVVLPLLEALPPWFIFTSSEAEYATSAFVDEGNDDGRLALTPFPGGETNVLVVLLMKKMRKYLVAQKR